MAQAGGAVLECILQKRDGFAKLKEWQDNQRMAYEAFKKVLVPFQQRLTVMAKSADSFNTYTHTFLEARVELDRKYARSLREHQAKYCVSEDQMNIPFPARAGGSISEKEKQKQMKAAAKEDKTASAVKKSATSVTDGAGSGGQGNRNSVDPSTDINSCVGHQDLLGDVPDAHKKETFAAFFEAQKQQITIHDDVLTYMHNDVLPALQKAAQEYAAATAEHTAASQKAFNLMVVKFEEAAVYWRGYEKLFREVEAIDRQTLQQQDAAAKVSRKFEDCWLTEKKCYGAFDAAREAQQAYMHALVKMADEVRKMEGSRIATVRQSLQLYLQKVRTTNGYLGGTLEQCCKTLDALDAARVCFVGDIDALLKDEGASLSRLAPAMSAPLQSPPSPSTASASIGDPRQSALFLQASRIAGYPSAPASSLVLKQGSLQRCSAGMFSSTWKDATAVLTADRFLHVYQQPTDPAPHWTICMAFTKVYSPPRKGKFAGPGPHPIELVETKAAGPFGMFASKKSYQIRLGSEVDHLPWLTMLKRLEIQDEELKAIEAGGVKEETAGDEDGGGGGMARQPSTVSGGSPKPTAKLDLGVRSQPAEPQPFDSPRDDKADF